MTTEKETFTQSEIGHKFVPEASWKRGHHYCFRGYRNFNKLLNYMSRLWKQHGIELEITDINMISYPYVCFNSGSVRNTMLIETFIRTELTDLKEQEIVGACSCKGNEEYWENQRKPKSLAETEVIKCIPTSTS